MPVSCVLHVDGSFIEILAGALYFTVRSIESLCEVHLMTLVLVESIRVIQDLSSVSCCALADVICNATRVDCRGG